MDRYQTVVPRPRELAEAKQSGQRRVGDVAPVRKMPDRVRVFVQLLGNAKRQQELAVDRRLQREGGSLVVADAVDFGSPSLEQQQVRSKVLTFYVNRAPYFLTSDPTFKPRPNTTTPRVVSWLVLANDSDPIDWSKPVSSTGGPQDNTAPVLVRTVTVYGKNAAGRDTSFVGAANVEFANISFSIPTYIVPGAIRAELRLDDYRPADADSHPGRTTIISVPLTLLGPEPADVPAGTGASSATQRPGSPQADGRRQ